MKLKGSNLKVVLSVFLTGVAITKSLAQDIVVGAYTGQTVISATHSVRLTVGFATTPGAIVNIFVGSLPTPAFSQDHCYTLVTAVKVPGITNESQLNGIDPSLVNQQVTYLDGFGRADQDIQIEASAAGNDIIMPHAYDIFGRETKAYLPYTSGSAIGNYRATALNGSNGYTNSDQVSFYQTPPPGVIQIPSGQVAYSETRFDGSPLDRAVEVGAPGLSWQIGSGHTKTSDISTNDPSDQLLLWSVTANGASSSGYIANGTLVKTVNADENGQTIVDYKDNNGKIICRKTQQDATTWLETDYIYNDLGNLCYVVPPLPASVGAISSFTEQTDVFNNLMYGYHYDSKRRVIETKMPGKGWVYAVYNKNDQPILAQDSRQKNNGIWIYNKYDAVGSIVMSGEYQDATDRATLQGNADAYTGGQWESFTNSTGNQGYTAATYPVLSTGNSKLLTSNYYSTYSVTGNSAIDPNPSVFAAPSAAIDTLNQTPVGLPTAMYTNVMGTNDYLFSLIQYDQYNRPVKAIKQTYQTGIVNNNQYDAVETQFNFDSTPCKSTRNSYAASPANAQLTLVAKIVYDHSGRVVLKKQSYNGAADVVIARYDYNELGQVTTKNLGSADGNNFLQHVDYKYNARGWLTRINDPTNLTDEHYTTQQDAFAMQLDYDQPNAAYGSTAQYNGNISTMSWQTAQPPATLSAGQVQEIRGYAISYDMQDRITGTQYKAASGNDRYNEQLTYDVLGNITSLNRTSGSGYLNQLSYNYGSGTGYSNQLISVADAGAESYSSNYTYDVDGAITADTKKQVTQTLYNDLGFPQLITFGNGETITYRYTGAGEKVERIIKQGGTVTEERSYNAGMELTGNQIAFIATGEGRAVPNAAGTAYSFEYYLTDQLGNVRAVVGDKNNNGTFDAGTDLVQVTDYYAFGREISNGLSATGPEEAYKYNGKEYQKDLNLYDFGARNYDPVISRWTSTDPMADKSRRFSPYNYVQNNPYKRIDPDGMYDQALVNQWSDEQLRDAGFPDVATKAWEDQNNATFAIPNTQTTAQEAQLSTVNTERANALLVGGDGTPQVAGVTPADLDDDYDVDDDANAGGILPTSPSVFHFQVIGNNIVANILYQENYLHIFNLDGVRATRVKINSINVKIPLPNFMSKSLDKIFPQLAIEFAIIIDGIREDAGEKWELRELGTSDDISTYFKNKFRDDIDGAHPGALIDFGPKPANIWPSIVIHNVL